jgi:hypothetical protein
MNGVVIRSNFSKISNAPTQSESLVTRQENECCFILPALAESSITSSLKNDKHAVYFTIDENYTDAVLSLQKQDASGNYEDIDDLTTDIVGTAYPLNFYTTIYNEQSIGYLIDWQLVLTEFGEGEYRVKCLKTLLDSTIQNWYSFEFCLREYTEERANETVYLEWYKNGNSGDIYDDKRKIDYGSLNWYNAVRVPNARFGKPNFETQKNYVRYQSGEQVWLQDDLNIDYTLTVDLIPFWFAEWLIKDANVNTEMYATDYNVLNHTSYTRKSITAQTVTPNYDESDILVSLELKYSQLFNNFIHKRG